MQVFGWWAVLLLTAGRQSSKGQADSEGRNMAAAQHMPYSQGTLPVRMPGSAAYPCLQSWMTLAAAQ